MATPRQGYWLDGQRLPSVTTVLGRYKDGGALQKWAYRTGREHGYARAQIDFLTKARMFINYIADAAVGAFKSIFGDDWSTRELPEDPGDLYAVTQKAANAGTIAHDMIEQRILKGEQAAQDVFSRFGLDGTPVDVLERAMNSYQQFLVWLKNTGIVITHTELSLVSRKHRYGGTFDGLGVDADGRRVLVDWKTSNGVYGDYLYQLAAYALLIEENEPDLTPTDFHLLRVDKERADFAHYRWGELDNEKRGFVLMRELYAIDAEVKKRCR